jgi:hypothetical protein
MIELLPPVENILPKIRKPRARRTAHSARRVIHHKIASFDVFHTTGPGQVSTAYGERFVAERGMGQRCRLLANKND